MDNLTHALLGLTVNNSLPEKNRTTFWVSLLASELPDVDILYVFSRNSADYLLNHRGFSHSVSALFLMAGLVALVTKKISPKEKLSSIFLLALGFLGLHVMFDILTSWGTQFLMPFSHRWFYLDWLPIIDIVIIAIAAVFWVIARYNLLPRRRAAWSAILLIFLYVFGRAIWHENLIGGLKGQYPKAKVSVMADLYPWHWKGIVELENTLIAGNINGWQGKGLDSVVQRKIDRGENLQYVNMYKNNPQFQKAIGFFRYPLYYRSDNKLVINDFYYNFREVIFPLDSEKRIVGKAYSPNKHRRNNP